MKENQQSKKRKFPPVRLSETGKADLSPAEVSYSNCDIQQRDPMNESLDRFSFKTEKNKNQGGAQAFFSRNLNFF